VQDANKRAKAGRSSTCQPCIFIRGTVSLPAIEKGRRMISPALPIRCHKPNGQVPFIGVFAQFQKDAVPKRSAFANDLSGKLSGDPYKLLN